MKSDTASGIASRTGNFRSNAQFRGQSFGLSLNIRRDLGDRFGRIQCLRHAAPGERRKSSGVRSETPERFGSSLWMTGCGYDDHLRRSGGNADESPCFGFSLLMLRSEDDGRFVRAGGKPPGHNASGDPYMIALRCRLAERRHGCDGSRLRFASGLPNVSALSSRLGVFP